VISDNPDVKYWHFGDIDIGGFLIHKHLCRETSKKFELYCMGIEQLCDTRFNHCLRKLTDNDMNRLETLIEDDSYRKVLNYMKERNIKLEQEIVSYYLEKEFFSSKVVHPRFCICQPQYLFLKPWHLRWSQLLTYVSEPGQLRHQLTRIRVGGRVF